MSTKEKQDFLANEIIEGGYSTTDFIHYLESKKDDGSDLDLWTIEELREVVKEFKSGESREEILGDKVTSVQKIQTFGGATLNEPDHLSSDNESESEEDHNEKQKDKEEEDLIGGEEWDKRDTNIGESIPLQNPEQAQGSNRRGHYHSVKEVQKRDRPYLVDYEGRLEIIVRDPEEVKTGYLQNNYTLFTVETKPLDWVVKRRYRDFEWLYKCLQNRFSDHYVNF